MQGRKIFVEVAAVLGAFGTLLALCFGACGRPTSKPLQAECQDQLDCITPGPCQVAENAGCVDSFCQYAAKTCDTQAPPTCLSGDSVYRIWAATGTCQPDGSCSYASTDKACDGCTLNCLGSCDGFACPALEYGCKVGHCVPGVGQAPTCAYDNAPDQQACDDGNACTVGDQCVSGACVPGSPQTCSALDECHVAGTCDPVSGCSNPKKATGTSCSGSSACGSVCNANGSCVESCTGTCCPDGNCSYSGTCGGEDCPCTTAKPKCCGGYCVGSSQICY